MDIELLEILNGFQTKCDELLSAADYKGSQLIYHFTSISNLEHIISKRQLLFTDYRDLNDCLEIEYRKNIVSEILSKTIREKIFSDKLTSFIQEDNFTPYISSFSTDINNLALWRFYADDGLGVAIGFDPQLPMENESIEESPLLAKVFYGKVKIEKIIQKLKKRITTITKSHDFLRHSDKDKLEFHRQILVPVFIYSIHCILSTFLQFTVNINILNTMLRIS